MGGREPRESARSFGLSVGGVSVLLGGAWAWRGHPGPAIAAIALGALLVATGLLRPAVLQVPSRLWWRAAHALGWLNARIFLCLAFAVVLTPMGLVRRLASGPARRHAKWKGWVPYPARYRDKTHYTRMY